MPRGSGNWAWVIQKNYKPARRTADGGYHRTYVGRLFTCPEDAEDYMHCMWHAIAVVDASCLQA